MHSTSVYETSDTAKRERKWKIAGWAIVLLICLATLPLLIILTFTTPPEKLPFGGAAGGVFGGLAALIFFAAAFLITSIRTPSRVELLPRGILLHSAHASREILYADIASTTCLDDASPQEQTRVVFVLAGANGKPLAKISNQIERFDDLKAEVRRRVAEMSGRTQETAEDDRRARLKQRGRQRRFILAGTGIMTIFGAAAFLFLGNEQLNLLRLAREGTEARGVVLRHYVHNNIAHRIEYAFAVPEKGSYSRNTMLPEEQWRLHGVMQPVTIVYIPEKPDFNRLEDEPEESHVLALCAGVFLVLTMGALFVTAWKGYDVEVVKGKIMLLRPGELREDRMPQNE